MSIFTTKPPDLDDPSRSETPRPLPVTEWSPAWKQVFSDTYEKPYNIDVEAAHRIIGVREHAEDATQNAGGKLFEAIGFGRLDAEHCIATADGNPKARPWYVSVHKHTSLDTLRMLIRERKRGEAATTIDVPDGDGGTRALEMDDLPAKSPELTVDYLMTMARIHLPEDVFQIFVLAEKGYSQVEIGQELSLTVDQIKGRLKLAMPILRKALRQELN